MKYIVYETRNLLNNKIYIGYHKTNNIHDEYLGSGKLLKKAINRYGKEHFKKKILHIYNSKTEALEKEKELVNEMFVNSTNTYNLKKGGEGGFDYINTILINDQNHMDYKYTKISNTMKQWYINNSDNPKIGWNYYNNNKDLYNTNPTHTGNWKHSETSKKKISENNANKLNADVIQLRLNDYNNIKKTRGWVTRLSEKWNVSHTQVRRFINKFEK